VIVVYLLSAIKLLPAFGDALLAKLKPTLETLAFLNRPAFVIVGLVEKDESRKSQVSTLLKKVLGKLKASSLKGPQLLQQV
jgi:hypothetical protein